MKQTLRVSKHAYDENWSRFSGQIISDIEKEGTSTTFSTLYRCFIPQTDGIHVITLFADEIRVVLSEESEESEE